MQNKKTIMAFSAILILIFHLWINVTDTRIEIFLRQLSVIGVDIFFFVSSYSLGKRKNIEYKSFIKNRFQKVYLKFIILSIIGMFIFNWNIKKFITIILGIELLTKGGGSFLWFLPGIMLMYIILPLYIKLDSKHPKIAPFIVITSEMFLTIIISYFTNYQEIFILTNRIPIILLGYYFAKHHIFEYLKTTKKRYWLTTIITLTLGIIISYLVNIYHFRLDWFKDVFYILYIPLIIGFILLIDSIKENKISKLIGSITLELYGLQMIFGFKIANDILGYTKEKLLSNIITILILILIASLIKRLFDIVNNRIEKSKVRDSKIF